MDSATSWCVLTFLRTRNVLMMTLAENFSTLCVVRANLSPLADSAQPKDGRNGTKYWTIVFSVEIHFGLTEFKARIKWVDPNGKIK